MMRGPPGVRRAIVRIVLAAVYVGRDKGEFVRGPVLDVDGDRVGVAVSSVCTIVASSDSA